MLLEEAARLFGMDEDVQFEREPVTGQDVRFAGGPFMDFVNATVKTKDTLGMANAELMHLRYILVQNRKLFSGPEVERMIKKTEKIYSAIGKLHDELMKEYDATRKTFNFSNQK